MAGCASAPLDMAGRQAQLQKKGVMYPAIGNNNAVAVSLTIWAATAMDSTKDGPAGGRE